MTKTPTCVRIIITLEKIDEVDMLNTLAENKPNLTLIHSTKIISFKEAMRLTGLCYNTFYALFRENSIPHKRKGKLIIFDKNDIINFMLEHIAGDFSKIPPESILLSCKCGVKELSQRTKTPYNTVLYNIRKTNFPRFEYGKKIIIPYIKYITTFSTDKVNKWESYKSVK